MRKTRLGVLLGVLAAMSILSLLVRDKLIERTMEEAGSAVVGARVEFDGVDFSLFDVRLRWGRMRVASPFDPWRNLFETGPADLNIMLEPLFLKRFIVENMSLDSLRFDTERQTSGALSGSPATGPGLYGRLLDTLEDQLEQIPVYNLSQLGEVNVDSVLRILELQTPETIDSLREKADSTARAWQRYVQRLPTRRELQGIRDELHGVDPAEIRTLEDATEALERLDGIRRHVDTLATNLDSIQNGLSRDIESLRESDAVVEAAIRRDYERALEVAGIPDFSSELVARAVLGRRVIEKLQTALAMMAAVRYYGGILRDIAPKREEPPRLAGQNIRYSPARDWPSFWLRRAAVSGEMLGGIFAEGAVLNVATNQPLTGWPTEVSISGESEGGAALRLEGVFNYLLQVPREEVRLELNGISLEGYSLSESNLLPYTFDSGIGRLQAEVQAVGDALSARIGFGARGLAFDLVDAAPENDTAVAALQRTIARSISSFSLNASLQWRGEQANISLSSDLGQTVAGILQATLSEQVDQARQQLQQRIGEEVEDERGELRRTVAERLETMAGVEQRLNALRREVRGLIADKERALRRRAAEVLQGEARERLDELLP